MNKVIIFFCIYALNVFAVDKIKVSVSIPPLYYFVNEIAKTKASIYILVPQNKNAELYEPSFKDMQILTTSDIFMGVGMPFEKIWLPKILGTNKQDNKTTILLLSEKLSNNKSMHIWLSLSNAKEITNIIVNALSEQDPANAKFYADNGKTLIDSINKLESDIKPIIKSMSNKQYIVYHPIFDKFDKEYGLTEHALEQHGKKYGIKEILQLTELGKKLQVKRVFAEYENKDIITLAKALDAKIVIIDIFSRDYLKNMESIFLDISKSYTP